jgi:branched-chain amino acid transport system permease protein
MLGQLLVNGVVIGSGYALIAMGHTMIYGLMKIVNFAHGEFYMIGAFFTYIFATRYNGFGLGFFGAMAGAVLITMLIGLVLDKFVFGRIRNEDQSVSTLVTIGLSILMLNGARVIWGAEPRNIPVPFSGSFAIGSISVTYSRLFIVLVTVAVIIGLNLLIKKTRTGKAFRATFQNREAALLAGIEIKKIYALNTSLGTGLAAVAGSLLGMIFVLEPTMGAKAMSVAWVVVITGGPGSTFGAILIGFLLGMAESLGGSYISSQYKDAIGFLLLVFILVLRPQGLFSKAVSRMSG